MSLEAQEAPTSQRESGSRLEEVGTSSVLREPARIGLLGCGVVGSGVARILTQNAQEVAHRAGAEIVVQRVAVRDVNKKRAVELPRELFTTDVQAVVTDPQVDVVVECIGGVGVAMEAVRTALENGKHVVTANKEMLAKHGHEILALADGLSRDLRFEGSVAGGIPIIHPLKESLAGDRIRQVVGIVNGTTNYILTKMSEQKMDFRQALAEAQARGYAESDPTDDISGNDAAYKLCILASIAFGESVDVEAIYKEGIESVEPRDIEAAAELGYCVKLLAIARRDDDDRLELRVHPAMLPVQHPLASVNDVFNAVFVTGEYVGDVMFYGHGAGSNPTGSVVVGDIIDVVRNIRHGATGRVRCTCRKGATVKPIDDAETCYYIRMHVKDQPGVLGAIATILGQTQVSVASVSQRRVVDALAEIVWITHGCPERNLRESLRRITELDVVARICNTIRVEA